MKKDYFKEYLKQRIKSHKSFLKPTWDMPQDFYIRYVAALKEVQHLLKKYDKMKGTK